MDTVHVANPQDATFERVETPNESDRVYLLTVDANAIGNADNNGRHFFWMQDRSDEMDEDICVKFNLYLSDVDEAKKAAGVTVTGANASGSGDGVNASSGDAADNDNNGAMDNDQLLRIMQGALGGEQGRAMTGE